MQTLHAPARRAAPYAASTAVSTIAFALAFALSGSPSGLPSWTAWPSWPLWPSAQARPRSTHHSSRGPRGHGSRAPKGARGAKAARGKRGALPAPVAAPLTWATPAEALTAGEAAFAANDDDTCLAAMNFILSKEKPEPKAWYWIGRVHGRHGRYVQAKDALEKFVNLMPVGRESDIANKLMEDYVRLDHTRFKVISDPPGALVALDDAKGPTVTAPAELPAAPGDHKLLVTLGAHEPQTLEVKAELGEIVPVSVTMKPLGCDLSAQVLVANTSGTVIVDEQSAATMPGPLRVRPGSHSVLLATPGAEPSKQQIQCRKDERLQASIIVPTPERGRIGVTVPVGGKLVIDGKEVPLFKQRGLVDVKPGDHLIDVEAEGNVPWHSAALVRAGETLEVRPTLEAGGGATGVEVTTDPPDATITIDDLPTTSGQMMRTGSGTRRIEARARGYFPVVRTINVITGERAHVEIRLAQRGRFLLFLGLAALPIAAGAEGLAILGHVNAGGELAGSAPYNRWHALEVSGHVVAGTALAVAVGSIAGWIVMSRQGDEPKPGVAKSAALKSPVVIPAVIPAIGPATGGATLSLSGSFR